MYRLTALVALVVVCAALGSLAVAAAAASGEIYGPPSSHPAAFEPADAFDRFTRVTLPALVVVLLFARMLGAFRRSAKPRHDG